MLNYFIKISLNNRLVVTALACFVVVYGSITLKNLPIDVFPDLTKPTITIVTEGHGRAPEEVETLITIPIENNVNGLPGLERVRSTSGVGLSVIYLEFSWDTDFYRSRQLVAEKLQLAQEQLPQGVQPIMAPISSLMGQIQQIALSTQNDSISPIELRTLAEWTIRPRLMAIPGVTQVIAIGGGLKQFQILISADKLNQFQINLEELDHSLSRISQNTTGGFLNNESQEVLIRNIGAVSSIEDIKNTVVGTHFGAPIHVKDIAEVKIGHRVKRGDGSYMARPAVVLTIQKQPGVDTVELTRKVDLAMDDLKASLPEALVINTDVFKQSNFINSSINGILGKLQIGTVLVFIVLMIFLANLKISLITLTAIPLSFFITFIMFKWFGLTVNTMTLGGLAIAIGELVDDSIVDVENIYRRIKENSKLREPRPLIRVIFDASSEVRNSIVMATIIIALVFLPLFSLTGIEGRLFTPLAISYLTALFASLVVSLSLTPVLASYLLGSKRFTRQNIKEDTRFVAKLKSIDRTVLNYVLDRPKPILILTGLLFFLTLLLLPFMGRNFLPQFNEGTAMVAVFSPPGTSLEHSNSMGLLAEKKLLTIPEIKSVSRRTGRAEQDEHAMGVNVSEIDVDFHKDAIRSREEILDDIRKKVSEIEGVAINVGQPISHLIDHTLSGVSAQIAIKIFGNDLQVLRAKASEVKQAIQNVEGLVDLRVEQQALVPELKIHILREEASKYGISAGEMTELLESAFNGHIVAQVLDGQKFFDLFHRFDEESRSSSEKMGRTIIKTMPNGQKVLLENIADIYETQGPNEISRENMQRRIIISANTTGRDLDSIIKEVRNKISTEVKLESGYYINYGGQFEAQKEASRKIIIFGILSILGIAIILYLHFQSIQITLQILLTIPFAFIGGIVFLFVTERTITVASMVGFVTLCGIASRNGIMMISHYLYLLKHEAQNFSKEMIIKGSLERLLPVLMTATVASLALMPLVLAKGEPGSEILHPVAVVIVGGLISSTLLDIIVTPTLFYNFSKKAALRSIQEKIKPL